MKHVNIKDVAAQLGISYSTVSRALANDPHIKAETRRLVKQTADLMGYRPNPMAANLRSGRSKIIGIIVHEMLTPHSGSVLAGIQELCIEKELRTIIFNSDGNPQREMEGLKLMDYYRVDGIIIDRADYRENLPEIEHLIRNGMPLVFYDRLQPNLDVTQVRIDDYGKACEVVEHLVAIGRKRILHIVGPDRIYNSQERQRAYRDVMTRHGLPILEKQASNKPISTLEGEEIAKAIVAEGLEFDAVFAYTDTLAIGIMNQLRRLGKRIPEDVAMAGFTGTRLSDIVYPQLTTVKSPLYELGQTAAQLLFEMVRNPQTPRKQVMLESEICIRESTLGFNP